ncbi:hypothetical protein SVAN01_03649 [Stagonosporopsis vannaccii]|nr:hypothetical protein SVAN01_03649 [Stagonosporopsis vannaccii]
MPPAYTAQQKAAISQFMSFTQMDRTAAVRVLKSHGWDAQNAVNALWTDRRYAAYHYARAPWTWREYEARTLHSMGKHMAFGALVAHSGHVFGNSYTVV